MKQKLMTYGSPAAGTCAENRQERLEFLKSFPVDSMQVELIRTWVFWSNSWPIGEFHAGGTDKRTG